MRRGNHALVPWVVLLLVVGACGISSVQAADIGTDVCRLVKGWGSAQTGSGLAGVLLLDLAVVPAGISGSAAPILACARLPEALDQVAGDVLAEPLAPRAPPIA